MAGLPVGTIRLRRSSGRLPPTLSSTRCAVAKNWLGRHTRVDAPIGRAAGLDAAVIDAAIALLRFSLTLRRFLSLLLLFVLVLLLGVLLLLCRLLMLLLLLFVLVLLLGMLLLLRGLRLLMLLPLLRFALLLTLLLMLCVGRDRSSEKQEQNCCADNASAFHICAPFEREWSVDAHFSLIMLVRCDLRVCPKKNTSPEVMELFVRHQ